MNRPLAGMFRYNNSANGVLIEAWRTPTDEQLDARIDAVSGSVHVSFTHRLI